MWVRDAHSLRDRAGEHDFWCEKQGKSIYVQVAYQISDEKTQQREFGNLIEIQDNYSKYVVTMDKFSSGSYKGIEHVHIIDFLTKDLLFLNFAESQYDEQFCDN